MRLVLFLGAFAAGVATTIGAPSTANATPPASPTVKYPPQDTCLDTDTSVYNELNVQIACLSDVGTRDMILLPRDEKLQGQRIKRVVAGTNKTAHIALGNAVNGKLILTADSKYWSDDNVAIISNGADFTLYDENRMIVAVWQWPSTQ